MIYRSCFSKLYFNNVKTILAPDDYAEYIKNNLEKKKVFIVSSGQFAGKVLEITSMVSVQKPEISFNAIIFTGNIEM